MTARTLDEAMGLTPTDEAELRAQVARLSRHRPWCIEHGHPGTTYNPLLNKTWCACGEVVTDGDTATHDLCCPSETP